MTDATRDLQTAAVMGKDLNHRQERFVQEFLVDLNATQAAIRAGYSPKRADVRGSDLTLHPKIKPIIDARKKELMERAGISSQMVIEKLWKVHNASMDKTTQGHAHNPAAANRSLELIGKHGGMWGNEHAGGDVQIQVNIHPHGRNDTE